MRHEDRVGGAVRDGELVVAGAVVGEEAEPCAAQRGRGGALDAARDGHAVEGPVAGLDPVERARAAFGQEVGRVGGGGGDDLAEGVEGVECFLGFRTMVVVCFVSRRIYGVLLAGGGWTGRGKM